MSNIPFISLNYFGPDIIRLSTDTAILIFNIQDGDADIGNNTSGSQYDIYIKDFRFDTGFAGYFFPQIDKSIEDPKKGVTGTCYFLLYSPDIISLRTDSIHTNFGDTTHFEFYIVDRAGHKSNHLSTKPIIMRP